MTRKEALRAVAQNKPPPDWHGYTGERETCPTCARFAVPSVGGILLLLVPHRVPGSEALCEYGFKNSWTTSALRESRRTNVLIARARAEKQSQVARKRKFTPTKVVPRVAAPEADLARRPCPKCSKVVTYSAGVPWDHPCGEKR